MLLTNAETMPTIKLLNLKTIQPRALGQVFCRSLATGVIVTLNGSPSFMGFGLSQIDDGEREWPIQHEYRCPEVPVGTKF
jgi:hypothetical protein